MKRKHIGSKFDDFLAEEGILEECRASAIKFAIAHKPNKTITRKKIAKVESARRPKTSLTCVD